MINITSGLHNFMGIYHLSSKDIEHITGVPDWYIEDILDGTVGTVALIEDGYNDTLQLMLRIIERYYEIAPIY